MTLHEWSSPVGPPKSGRSGPAHHTSKFLWPSSRVVAVQDQIDARAAQRQSDGSAGPVHPCHDSPSRRHRAGALTCHSEVAAHPLTIHDIHDRRATNVTSSSVDDRTSSRVDTYNIAICSLSSLYKYNSTLERDRPTRICRPDDDVIGE